MHAHIVFVGAAADQRGDQVGLHRRTTGTFDVENHRPAARGAECAVDQRCHGSDAHRTGRGAINPCISTTLMRGRRQGSRRNAMEPPIGETMAR